MFFFYSHKTQVAFTKGKMYKEHCQYVDNFKMKFSLSMYRCVKQFKVQLCPSDAIYTRQR